MRRRRLAVALVALNLVALPSAHAAFGEHVIGPQRVLVALVTWGPQPFQPDEVRDVVFNQADAFYRSGSYGKASLTGVVTPWLKAFAGPISCNLAAVRIDATAAARAAGFDPARYDRVVFVHPQVDCPWSGVTQAATVFLNGAVTRYLVSHELGHSFGLGHANLTDCKRHGCGALEYGDPYDTMGSGMGDFSARAKFGLGWITRIAKPGKNGTYELGAIERPSRLPQALVVTSASDEYWVEYRSEPAQTAGAGVIVRVSPSPDLHDLGSSGLPNLLLADPAGRHRPDMLRGDRFVDAGVFALTVQRVTHDSVRLRFTWRDAVAPRVPRITAAIVAGRLEVTVEDGHDSGSGVARYDISVDGRAPLSISGNAAEDPVQIGRPLPGTHSVKIVAFDRAGNHSAPAVRRIRVP